MTNEIQKMDAAEILQPTALEALNRGEVDMMIVTAKKYPRDIARIKQKIEQLATLDEETAEMCFYAIPRDGKTIEGPSVRLAEIALTCYTNIKAGFRPMSNDGSMVPRTLSPLKTSSLEKST